MAIKHAEGEEPAVPAHPRRRHYEDDDDVYEEVHRRTRSIHAEAVSDASRKILVGLGVVLSTVLGTFGTTQYQAKERTEEFSSSLEQLSRENAAILKQLSELLNANLARTAEMSQTNVGLNERIIRDNEIRKQYHLKELKQLEAIEKKLEKAP